MLKIVLKNLFFLIVAPGTVTVFVPYLLLSRYGNRLAFDIGSARFLGLVPLAFGAAIYLWCDWSFAFIGKATPLPIDAPKVLVVKGPFRFVRNPFYIGIVSVLLGEGVLFQSGVLLLYAVFGAMATHLFVVLYEEPHLRKTFGASYVEYCRETHRWMPKLWIL